MSETIYFNDKGTNYKAEWLEENYPENPRDENFQTNLGTMVFEENRRYNLGDKQVDGFYGFFKEQLSEKDFPIRTQGSIIFDFPDVEDAKKDPRLSYFVTGNEDFGYKFDKNLFYAEFRKSIDSIKERCSDVCEELHGYIPLRSDASFENWYIIDFKTPYGTDDYSEIKNAVEEELAKYGLKITSVHPEEINQLEELHEKELYQKWKETKACVIPLSLYEHSGLTVHASSEEYNVYGEIANSGFIYVDKDNPEFLNMLKGEARDETGKVYNKWTPKTEEEAKKWAEGILRSEIEDYAAYLEGDVHNVKISYFDKEKMDWIDNDYGTMTYGSSLEENLQSHGFDISNKLDKNKVFVLENSVNPEFKAVVGKEYIEAVKKELDDFDNNPKLAAKSVSKQWAAKEDVNIEETDRINRWSLKKQALNEFFKSNGCDSPEKIFSFLAEKVGVKRVERSLEPLSIFNENLHSYISIINNPSRSDNHGIGKLLLVDEQNMRMALMNSPSYAVLRNSIYTKVTTLSSAKKVEEKAEELLHYGFRNADVADECLKHYQKKVERKSLESEGRER